MFKKILACFVSALIILVPLEVNAEELEGKVTSLTLNEKAPYAGILLDPIAASKMVIDKNLVLTHHNIKEKITIINFFASWCLPCKDEHPLLMDLKKKFPKLMIIGFDYKDSNEEGLKFLSVNGNPYNFVGIDHDGKIGLEFRVFGLPETLLTNSQGKIIYRHTGPLSNEVIQEKIIPNL